MSAGKLLLITTAFDTPHRVTIENTGLVPVYLAGSNASRPPTGYRLTAAGAAGHRPVGVYGDADLLGNPTTPHVTERNAP